MAFTLVWTQKARETYDRLKADAISSLETRQRKRKPKSSQSEGLFKQVKKCVDLLKENPRHPGLSTHEFHSKENPHTPGGKVFEAYVQQRTSGAYRLFWCYDPKKDQITILAITPHP
jgi:mRNA-degrading endonuclease RelE of RelBE toxin-antitoxin system